MKKLHHLQQKSLQQGISQKKLLESTEKDQNFKFLSHLKLPSVTSVIHVSNRNGSSQHSYRQAMEPQTTRNYNYQKTIPSLKNYVDEMVDKEEEINTLKKNVRIKQKTHQMSGHHNSVRNIIAMKSRREQLDKSERSKLVSYEDKNDQTYKKFYMIKMPIKNNNISGVKQRY